MLPLWPRVRKYWFLGYIDVGDGCWSPFKLVRSSWCWWPFWNVGDRFSSPTTKQVTNTVILPQTSWNWHHHKFTSITLSPTSLSPIFVLHIMIQVLYFFFNRYFMRHLDNLGPLDWFPHYDQMISSFFELFFDQLFWKPYFWDTSTYRCWVAEGYYANLALTGLFLGLGLLILRFICTK